LIIATNHKVEVAIETYAKRWSIETLFGCLKTKGFNFEDTHLKDRDRISNIIVLLAIGFCWCHKIGEWCHEIEPIKIKKHGRKAISLFRYGLDFIRTCLLNLISGDAYKSLELCIFALLPGRKNRLLEMGL